MERGKVKGAIVAVMEMVDGATTAPTMVVAERKQNYGIEARQEARTLGGYGGRRMRGLPLVGERFN